MAHYAALVDDVDMLTKVFAESKYVIDSVDSYQNTPMHTTCYANNAVALEKLLGLPTNTCKQNVFGYTPLYIATERSWHHDTGRKRQVSV